MRKLILSGFADEYAPELDEQLAGWEKLDFHHMEVRFADGVNVSDFTVDRAADVRRKLDRAGVAVSAVGSPLGKVRLDTDHDAHMEKARRIFWTAGQLDCRYVRVFSFYPPKGGTPDGCRDEVIARMGALLDLADEYGVTLCHENEAKIYGESPENCLDLLRTFSGRLRCVFDMGNFRLKGIDTLAAYETLKDYIAYFHIKDSTAAGVIVPPGEGEAQIEAILKRHRAAGEGDCVVSLEPHLTAFVGLSALAGEKLKRAYSFDTPAAAYTDAADRLKRILAAVENDPTI